MKMVLIMKKKTNLKKLIVSILVIITVLMVAIAFIPGAERVVPAPVFDFASKFYAVAVGVTIAVIGLMAVTSSPVVGVGLLLIGAFIIWQQFLRRNE